MATSTVTILLNLLKCLLTHYAVYYIVSAACFGAFALPTFDGRMPFNFQTFIELPQCCWSYTRQQLANLTCMWITYFVNIWTFSFITKKRVWDYTLTISLFHIALSCLVMFNFPLNWTWWTCFGAAVIIQIVAAESLLFCFMDFKKEPSSKIKPVPVEKEKR